MGKKSRFKRDRFEAENQEIKNDSNETGLSQLSAKILEYLWLALIIFIPLVYWIGLDMQLVKFYVLGIIVMTMLFFYIIRAIEIKKIELKLNTFTAIMLLIFLSIILAVIFSRVPEYSFWGSERAQGLVTFVLYFVLFLIVAGSIKKESQVQNIVTAIAWSGFINGMIAIFHHYNHFVIPANSEYLISAGIYRAEGLTGNPIFLGGLLAFTLPFVVYRYYFSSINNESYYKYLYLLMIVVNFIGLYDTSTRSALLAVFAGFVIYLVIVGLLKKNNWLWISAMLITVIMSASIISLNTSSNPLHIPSNSVTVRFSNLLGTNGSSSFESRLLIWRGVVKPMKDYFWVGVGPDALGPVLQRSAYFDKVLFGEEMLTFQRTIERAHNIFLDSMLSVGIIGTLSFLALIFYVLINLVKKIFNTDVDSPRKYLLLVFLLSGIVILIHGLAAFYEIISFSYIFLLLGAVYFLFYSREDSFQEKKKYNFNLPLNSIAVYSLTLVVVLTIFILMVQPVLGAELSVNDAAKKISAGNIVDGQEILISNFDKFPWNFKAIQQLEVLISKTNNKEELKMYEEKFTSFQKSAPDDIYIRILLSALYNHMGIVLKDDSYFKKSDQMLNDALVYFGDRYQLYFFYIYNSASRGKFDVTDAKIVEALLYSNKLMGQDYLFAARGAYSYTNSIGSKDYSKAINYLNQINKIPDSGSYQEKYYLLGTLYTSLNDSHKAVEAWKECIVVLPKDTDCLGNLSVYYAKNNDFDNALKYVDLLIQADAKKGNALKEQIQQVKKQGTSNIK